MSRRDKRIPRPPQTPQPPPVAPRPLRKPHSGRESVESFVLVFLGFLVWSLEAEGFVIPTGSMAPTLMGRHKAVTCPQCSYAYTVNADREVESSGQVHGPLPRVRAGTCVNCRYEASIIDQPSFAGDRIYVMKSGLSLPFTSQKDEVRLDRWDVGVFKLPENPEVRYIKRTVGMPGEVIRIQAGDLWVRKLDDLLASFERLRRPLEHQQAMQMMVYDDAHRPKALADDPRWKRWAPSTPNAWTEPSAGRFRTAASATEWSELRYRHLVPEPSQWRAILEGSSLPKPPRASLINDFYSYNTDVTAVDGRNPSRPWFQPNWVGDLTLTFRLKTDQAAGQLRIELIKAGVPATCEVDLARGQATLKHGDKVLGTPFPSGIKPGSEHEIMLANVDDRLTLSVDGAYPFGDGMTFDPRPDSLSPREDDLEPVRIAVRGGAVEVSGLVLKRDIHYTLEPAEADELVMTDLRGLGSAAFFDLLADPSRFSQFERKGARDFRIGPGCYLMLGDNSPWSLDGRKWGQRDQRNEADPSQGWDDSGRSSWEVPERLVVGKAFAVYWPSTTPLWPRLRLGEDLVLPSRPSLERIRWIR